MRAGVLAEGGGSAEAADTFDSGDEGARPSLELEARRLESLRKTVHVGRAHSLKPIAAEGPKLQRLTEAAASEARQDDPTPEAEEGPAGPVETYTKVQVQEQLAALQFKFTQQLGEATLQLQQKFDQLTGDFQRLQKSHQRLEQDVAHERAQQVQQQLALQTEMRATGDRVSQETISTVERLDRGARQANMFMSGVVMPAGGKGQLVKHVEQLFHQHAEVPRGAISDVICVGPIRSAGPKSVIVKFRSIREKHAAFQGSAVMRSRRIYLDDDLTKAQQATRRALEPEKRRLQQAGMRTWWRLDRLHHSGEDSAQGRPSQPPARGPSAAGDGPAQRTAPAAPRRAATAHQSAPRPSRRMAEQASRAASRASGRVAAAAANAGPSASQNASPAPAAPLVLPGPPPLHQSPVPTAMPSIRRM